MFKKNQKYLLLNYPLLWNTKIIPMGLAVIGFNLFFFFLGFISENINFQDSGYYRNNSNIIFFLITGLTSVLVLIVWLVYYLKNNAFKSFYPKKPSSLYWEWIIVFVLLFGNVLYTSSYMKGIQFKERTFASKEEVQNILTTLNKVEILLPESDSYYYARIAKSKPQTDSLQNEDSISISLLNYNKYSSDSTDYYVVKKWLREEKQDSIKSLMTQYFNIQKKHNLTTNLTIDTWMKLVYNPPHFLISPSNYINKSKPYNAHVINTKYYVEYENLYRNYSRIYDAYNRISNSTILITLYIALSLSVLLLSFRITSGKSWLISFVAAGLLCFINGIITAVYGINGNDGNDLLYLTIFYWSVVLAGMIFYMISKIYGKKPKGKSTIILNLIFWIFPFISLLYYGGYMASNIGGYYTEQDKYTPTYQFFNDNPTVFFWINIIFVSVVFYFFMKLVKRWRALPEE